MTTPNDPPREPTMDPSDPRWVDDVLARARRRAEEARAVDPASRPPVAPGGAEARPPAAPVAQPPAAPTARPPDAAGPRPPAVAASRPQDAPVARQPVAPDGPPQGSGRGPVPPAAGTGAPTARTANTPTGPDGPRPRPAAPADTGPPTAAPDPTARLRAQAAAAQAAQAAEIAQAEAAVAARRPAGAPRGPAEPSIAEPADAGTDDEPTSRALRSWLEWGGVIVGALVVAFVIRAVAFQAFYIPSESMEHTLEVQDRILVNKLSYRLHDVNRGDIIVFEKPPGETSKINDLIKRVIALPGETIEQQGADIYIDRGEGPQKLTESYINDPADTGQAIAWVQGCTNPSSEASKCTIPEGHVWVMGDNRGHSHDSRMFGPIDEDLIVGRAFVKVWPLNKLGFL